MTISYVITCEIGIVLSDSDYPFGILDIRILITPLVS
jgi:hypothetical protein